MGNRVLGPLSMPTRVKFDFFVLVEFCNSNFIFKGENRRTSVKVFTLISANAFLKVTPSWLI